ncbi:hypothetical protein SESBI_25546 [Sesbania bispinosa]|nr:hypothetical protein SESBI_25546 [Sesbania bispinosa]
MLTRGLRVVLQAIELGGGVLYGGNDALLATRDNVETGGKRGGFVVVAHPNELFMANFFRGEEGGGMLDVDFHAAIFLLVADADLATEALDEELEAVANAEDEDTVGLGPLKEVVGEGGELGVWTEWGPSERMTTEGLRSVMDLRLEVRGAGDAEGENREASDVASDEVSVLGTKVED